MSPQEFVTKVVLQYGKGIGIFEKKINAEELVPNYLGERDRALFIFYVLQLDYAMKSQILYNGANRLYRDNRFFFTPSHIASLSDKVLARDLKEYLHPRYINEAVRRYKSNTETLIKKYEGDPRVIFRNTRYCQDVLQRLKDFRGFGPKIGNFFVRTMINTFGYNFADIDKMLPPVDIHDVRIAYLLGYTDTDKMTPKNINFVKNLWSEACNEAHKSWLVFDKALWLLDSEGKPKTKKDVLNLLK